MTLTILLVEDIIPLLHSTRLLLSALDDSLEILIARSGEEALQILHQSDVNAIISDYQMPGMSGLDLLRVVRGEGFSKPFILLTADTSISLKVYAKQAGVTEIFYKASTPRARDLYSRILETIQMPPPAAHSPFSTS